MDLIKPAGETFKGSVERGRVQRERGGGGSRESMKRVPPRLAAAFTLPACRPACCRPTRAACAPSYLHPAGPRAPAPTHPPSLLASPPTHPRS